MYVWRCSSSQACRRHEHPAASSSDFPSGLIPSKHPSLLSTVFSEWVRQIIEIRLSSWAIKASTLFFQQFGHVYQIRMRLHACLRSPLGESVSISRAEEPSVFSLNLQLARISIGEDEDVRFWNEGQNQDQFCWPLQDHLKRKRITCYRKCWTEKAEAQWQVGLGRTTVKCNGTCQTTPLCSVPMFNNQGHYSIFNKLNIIQYIVLE
jgi:hypothetical protein